MKIIIALVIFFLLLVPVIILGNKIGEKLEDWLEEHFPNVEE